MAKHIVKCVYCGESFDASVEEFEMIGRRYAHKKCFDEAGGNSPYKTKQKKELTKEEQDLKDLKDYVKNLFKENYSSARITKQIKQFKEEYNYTYSGILKTLIYWYDIKMNTLEKSKGGIGIVPYIYQDALQYYYAIYLANEVNANVSFQKMEEVTVEIESPRAKMPIKLFKLEGE